MKQSERPETAGDFGQGAANARQEVAVLFAEALTASRLRVKDKLIALVTSRAEIANLQDSEGKLFMPQDRPTRKLLLCKINSPILDEHMFRNNEASNAAKKLAGGRCCLHYAAEHCEGLEEVLAVPGVKSDLRDKDGDTPLHFAATASCPLAAYALAKSRPAACLERNTSGKTAACIAEEKNYGEVLNAMLLACCSSEANPKDSCKEALESIEMLLKAGAVPDTWAPNGNSALMMAASANSPTAIALLLGKGAQINMKDTLGRTALMFAAGNDARAALEALMDAGGQEALSLQDNRGNNVTNYACGEETKRLLEQRFAKLEEAASAHQAALLADLAAEELLATKQKRTHRSRKKKKGAKAQPADRRTSLEPLAECDSLRQEQPGLLEDDSTPAEDNGLQDSLQSEKSVDQGSEKNSAAEKLDGPIQIQADATLAGDCSASTLRLDERNRADGELQDSAESLAADQARTHDPDPATLLERCQSPFCRDSQGAEAQVPQKEGKEPASKPKQACETSKRAVCDLSQEDREAITAALRCDLEPNQFSEKAWKEVKKPAKSGSKARVAKRSHEKFFDAPTSLLPSSSSVSLDSLGDSSASGASALSLPSGALHLVPHLPAPSHPTAILTSTHCAGRRERQLKAADSSAAAPMCPDNAPKSIAQATSMVVPNMSWSHVVQGKAAASPTEEMPMPQTKEGEGVQKSDLPLSSGHDKSMRAQDIKQREADEHCLAACSLRGLMQTLTLDQCTNHGPEASGRLNTGDATDDSSGMKLLQQENQALRKQLLVVEANRLQLQTQLMSVQQDHRLMLQQAVEDTARNILAQEQKRSRSAIEALQLLLLEAHSQLQQSRALQQAALLSAQSGLLHGGANNQLVPDTLRHPCCILKQPGTSPRNASPACGRTVSPCVTGRAASMPTPAENGLGPGLGAATSEMQTPHFTQTSTGSCLLASSPCDVQQDIEAAFHAGVSTASRDSQGLRATANPWVSTSQASKEEASAALPMPLLPSLDSIWGPSSAKLSKKSFSNAFKAGSSDRL